MLCFSCIIYLFYYSFLLGVGIFVVFFKSNEQPMNQNHNMPSDLKGEEINLQADKIKLKHTTNRVDSFLPNLNMYKFSGI